MRVDNVVYRWWSWCGLCERKKNTRCCCLGSWPRTSVSKIFNWRCCPVSSQPIVLLLHNGTCRSHESVPVQSTGPVSNQLWLICPLVHLFTSSPPWLCALSRILLILTLRGFLLPILRCTEKKVPLPPLSASPERRCPPSSQLPHQPAPQLRHF